MDKPNILDILVGYCAGKGGFDRIERRRLQRHFRTLPDPSESRESIEPDERAKPSNFLTPWKESNFGVTFRCRKSPDAETQYRYHGRFSSFKYSDRAVVLEIGSTSPEDEARSPTPPKQISFIIPPVWSTEHTTSFPTIALPELVVSRLQETQLNAILQQHSPGRQSGTDQQSPNFTFGGDDDHNECGTRTIPSSTNHPREVYSEFDEPSMRVSRGSEPASRIFPHTSQQTTIERVLYHEYRVRGLLRNEGPTTEERVDRRYGMQQDGAVIIHAVISDEVERRSNGFISIEESSSPSASAKQGHSKRHVARMSYRARVTSRPLGRHVRSRQARQILAQCHTSPVTGRVIDPDICNGMPPYSYECSNLFLRSCD
jgi:hypothetical protein